MEEVFLGEEFDHFAELKRVAAGAAVVSELTLEGAGGVEVEKLHLDGDNCAKDASSSVG